MSINKNHTIKILKGTVVKFDGHPIRLTKSIQILVSDNEFSFDLHTVLLDEDLNNIKQYINDDDQV